MTKRKYSFELPHATSGLEGSKINFAINNMAEVKAALPHLTPALVDKLKRVGFWHSETFTQADLDSIPDSIWEKLAPHLG